MTEGKILIIDYEVGNVRSVENAFRTVRDLDVIVSNDPREIEDASCLILPGVGAFDDAVKALRNRNLIPVLETQVLEKKKPLLAICVGMQVLFERSEEGSENGLGWMPGEIVRFDIPAPLTVPHFGWNNISNVGSDWLFDGMGKDRNFYFAHSYHARPHGEHVIATCDYGGTFAAAVRRDNIIATQFHPEKSHNGGLSLLRNFLRFTEGEVHA